MDGLASRSPCEPWMRISDNYSAMSRNNNPGMQYSLRHRDYGRRFLGARNSNVSLFFVVLDALRLARLDGGFGKCIGVRGTAFDDGAGALILHVNRFGRARRERKNT